jgi:hypothetical protein
VAGERRLRILSPLASEGADLRNANHRTMTGWTKSGSSTGRSWWKAEDVVARKLRFDAHGGKANA